jgi:hypothetical protein
VLDLATLYAHVLTIEVVAQVVLQELGQTEDHIFTPLVTLATFLFQILSNDLGRGALGLRRRCREVRLPKAPGQNTARLRRGAPMVTRSRLISMHAGLTIADSRRIVRRNWSWKVCASPG